VANHIAKLCRRPNLQLGPIKPPQRVNPWSHILRKLLKTWRPCGSCTKIVTAKWLKLAAALLLRSPKGKVQASGIDDAETLVLAIQLCNRAFQLNQKAGVKNMIERCVMRLNALAKSGDYDPNRLPQVAGLSLEPSQIDLILLLKNSLPAHSKTARKAMFNGRTQDYDDSVITNKRLLVGYLC